MADVPIEFIPPTIVVIIAAVVWLLARMHSNLSAPAEQPDAPVEDFFGPYTDTMPETASDMTPERVKEIFDALIAATWTEADERRRLLRRRALPKPRPHLPNPRTTEGDRDV